MLFGSVIKNVKRPHSYRETVNAKSKKIYLYVYTIYWH